MAERKERALDGIGDKVLEARKAFLQTSVGQKLGVLWEQGVIELANATYQGTPIPMPQAITLNQIEDPMKQYESSLTQASQKAHEHQPQHELER
jgi:hypothetical protein